MTLMVYVGPEKVWTPGHKDICGSLGHNVMVYAEPQAYSMWFCIGRRKYDIYSLARAQSASRKSNLNPDLIFVFEIDADNI